jgi:hypothetical protein
MSSDRRQISRRGQSGLSGAAVSRRAAASRTAGPRDDILRCPTAFGDADKGRITFRSGALLGQTDGLDRQGRTLWRYRSAAQPAPTSLAMESRPSSSKTSSRCRTSAAMDASRV